MSLPEKRKKYIVILYLSFAVMCFKHILLYTIYAGLQVGILAETNKVKRQKLLTIFSLTEKVEKVL